MSLYIEGVYVYDGFLLTHRAKRLPNGQYHIFDLNLDTTSDDIPPLSELLSKHLPGKKVSKVHYEVVSCEHLRYEIIIGKGEL